MVAHKLARAAIYMANPRVFELMSNCIATDIMNDMS
jgi:hypothetical protein